MRPLLVAAVLAAAFPGSAFGAGLVARDLAPQPAGREVSTGVYELVGVHWRGPGVVKYRTRNLAGRWSAWRTFSSEDALPDNGRERRATRGWRVASPFWTGPSNGIQYRTVGSVERLRAYFVSSPREGPSTKHAELAGAPPIMTRAGWHANEAIRRGAPFYADSVHFAIVHHTAGSNSYTKAQSASIVRAIELYHVKANGWNDIGYNFLLDKYGQIFEGRYGGMTRPVIGAHAQGFNTGSVGVAVIGDYSSTGISPAARAALVSLLAWRLDLQHVDPASSLVRVSSGNPRYPAGRAVTLKAISGHRDVYPTTCPGQGLYAQLPSIRAAVAKSGLPKLYAPAVAGTLGGFVHFTARLSERAAWVVSVKDQNKVVVASGSGIGGSVDWTWDATTATSGLYSWTITAPQMRSATGTIGTAPAPLALQKLKLAPALVTPNGDGRGDAATLSYRLTAPALVTATVLDSFGDTVQTLFSQRKTAGTQTFVWSGVSLPDGRYRLVLAARDDRGAQVQSTHLVSVDRTLASFVASAPAISPNGDGRLDGLDFSFRLNAAAHVQLRILRAGALVATPFEGDLPAGPQRLPWDGGGLQDGRYTAVVVATDSLMTVKQSVFVRVDTKAPTLRLASFRLLRFWLSEPGRLTVVLNGRAHVVALKRAGFVRVGHTGAIRVLRAYARDAAGNQSRQVRGP
jgi:N-acetylmuramoyl-L-alanine amidase-like protein/flagellar hook capping protein FlgD